MGPEGISEAALGELAEANRKKVWFKALNMSLSVRDVDYFEMFEQSAATQKGSVSSRWDQSGRRFVMLVRVFVTYVCIKLTIITYVHYSTLKMRSRAAGTQHSRTILSEGTCKLLTQILGNPFDSIYDIAINLYVGPQFVIVPSLLVTYLFKRHHKLDCPPCRLLQNPQFELKRIDSSIRNQIDMIGFAIKNYKQNQACSYFRKNHDFSNGSKHLCGRDRRHLRLELANWWRSEKKFCQQIVLLTYQLRSKEQLSSLRPINLRPEYYVKMSKLLDSLSIVNCVVTMLVAVYILMIVIVPSVSRCRTGPICSPLKVLTWPEFLLIPEISLFITLCGAAYTRNLEATILLVVNQLDILKELTRNLEDFLRPMKSEPAPTIDKNRHRPAAGACRPHGDDRHKKAMQLLIKLAICDEELEKNSRSISIEASEQSALLPSVVVVVVLSNWLNIKGPAWMYLFLLFVGLLMGNLYAILYAHIYSKTIHLERKFWPLLANLMADNQAIYYNCERLQLKSCSFVIEMLRKFLILSGADIKRHMISAIGIGLNYEKIIQVNFFVVFVYSFTNQNV